MKLATKGLLLICIPVAVQVVIVITFASLLWQAQTFSAHEAHAKEIISECDKVILDGFQIAQKVLKFGGDNGPVTDEDVRGLKQHSATIQQQLSEDGMNTEASEIGAVLNNFYDILVRVKLQQEAPSGPHYALEKDMFRIVENLMGKFSKVITVVNDQQQVDLNKRKQLENLTSNLLFGTVALCVILTIGLAYFAYNSLRRPLIRMSANAKRMSERLPLELVPDEGNDELAQLDRLFHNVNDAVNDAFDRERNLITHAADVVCSIDERGNLINANPYTSLLLKFDENELQGISIFDLVSPADCAKVDSLFQTSTKTGTTCLEEIQMVTKNKTTIETAWSNIWSKSDQSFFCVMHDITERKQLERLKQDFIAMISHDLRTPLMSLNSAFELVQSGAVGAVPTEAQPQLSRAIKNTEHLIELVNDLLDFEKLEAGRMDFELSNSNLKDLIEQAKGMVESLAAAKNITIRLEKCDYQCDVDSRKVVQVMINLLSNALKHAPESSTILIKTRKLEDKIEVSVHDSGAGVPEELSRSIFSPFEQVAGDPQAKLGTGLGLAICKLMIEGHGGSIGVRQSDFGQGSGFWFTVSKFHTSQGNEFSQPVSNSL